MTRPKGSKNKKHKKESLAYMRGDKEIRPDEKFNPGEFNNKNVLDDNGDFARESPREVEELQKQREEFDELTTENPDDGLTQAPKGEWKVGEFKEKPVKEISKDFLHIVGVGKFDLKKEESVSYKIICTLCGAEEDLKFIRKGAARIYCNKCNKLSIWDLKRLCSELIKEIKGLRCKQD